MKLIKWLISYLRKITNKRDSTTETESLFTDQYDEIIIGDLVWALMPLSAVELDLIEKNHQVRPYLVVAKDQNHFYGYYCSTKPKSRYLAVYKLDKDIYNHRRNTYVYLNNVYKIPRANFKNIYNHVEINNLIMIERKLMVNSRFIEGLMHFDIAVFYRTGDIICVNSQLYYIYQYDNTNLYTYKAKFNRKNPLRYEIDFSQAFIFDSKKEYELVNILAPQTIAVIKEQIKKYKYKNKNKKNKKIENTFIYPQGSIFEDRNGDKIIYLYSRGKHHYGINTKYNDFFPYICTIQNIEKTTKLGFVNEGKMLIMLERLLDQNINPHNAVIEVYDDLIKHKR